MGRGRAKAKQAKVARQLKYSSPNTDLAALERELSGGSSEPDEDGDPYVDDRRGTAEEPREEDWLPRKR